MEGQQKKRELKNKELVKDLSPDLMHFNRPFSLRRHFTTTNKFLSFFLK